ncbi:MAG: signal peptidase II, partial [Chloroflexi bacterium]|nr:signal peptidase II [Chloroflexota bacterium]
MAEHLESKAPDRPAEPPSVRRQWYRDPLLILTIPAVLALDQLTKLAILSSLRLGESWPSEGFVRFTHAQNTGSAFGLFPNQTVALIVASVIAIGFLFYFYRAHALPSPWLRLAIGMQLGGAMGNLLDR